MIKLGKKKGEKMKKVTLAIDGMTCSACSNGLEKYLKKQDGIKSAVVNLVMNNATIEYDEKKLKLSDLDLFVAKAGFKSLGIDSLEKERKKSKFEKYRLIILLIVSLLTMYISMGHMIGFPQVTFIDMTFNPLGYVTSQLVLAIISMLLGFHILRNGIKNLIHYTPNMDSLVTVGVLASFIYSLYASIMIGSGKLEFIHNLYFESISMVILFIELGKYIENRYKDKTKEAIKGLVTITPKEAVILRDDKELTVTIDEIKKGDIVICKPGEKIAVDGTIVEGQTHIDESFITGESTPVKKQKDSKVLAGSINYEGAIKYRAEKIGINSTVSEIVKMVQEATNTKMPIAKIADTISGYFVPIVFGIAVFTYAIWQIISQNIATSLDFFVTVLVVACPCSLGLATPLAVIIANGNASRKGILIKSSDVLENANNIKYVVFDKTGTLTKGKLSVSKFIHYSNIKDLEKNVASIESLSEHPIAKGIVNYAKENNINTSKVEGFKALVGLGVYGICDADEFFIGNIDLMNEEKITITSKAEADANLLKQDGNTVLYIAMNKVLVGLIALKDIIREEAAECIKKLKNRKINVYMLTGDNPQTASSVANSLGIEHIIANVKPKDKAEKIEELKQNGIVLMCGDGINDSVSLVSSDIGVSISNGTDIAIDSANVVLMNDDIDKINDLIDISKKTVKNIKQNLFWAFFYNICMIPIAAGALVHFGLKINPMIAAAAMALSSITVVLNALRVKNKK